MQDHDLDVLLRKAAQEKPQPSAALYGALLAQMTGPRPFGWRDFLAALWPFGPAWQPAGALALMAVLGVLLSPTLNPASGSADEITLADASFSQLLLGDDAVYGISFGSTNASGEGIYQ